MEFYYKSYCCFGPRHGVLLQPASINHLTATLHILVPYILCFCPQKYYGLPRGRDSQFWQRTLGSTSNTNWTCCRFHPRINLKPDNGPRSWSCSVEWRLRFEKNKIKNRVAEQRANSKFKKNRSRTSGNYYWKFIWAMTWRIAYKHATTLYRNGFVCIHFKHVTSR